MTEHPAINPGYGPLYRVLVGALEQAQTGKGEQRHGRGRAFMDQPMFAIAGMTGPGGPAFQAMKKTQEALTMDANGLHEAAYREVLGAINYLGALALIFAEKTK